APPLLIVALAGQDPAALIAYKTEQLPGFGVVGIDLDRALEEVVHVADEALILRPHRQREHVGCRRASPKGGHPFLVTMNRGLPGDDLLDLRPRDADVPEPGLDKYPIGFFVGDA